MRSTPKQIIELGSSAGISGCYLASGRYCQTFITLEGSAPLARLAESHLRQVSNRFEVLNMSFNEGLDKVLSTLSAGIDMVYIDGSKENFANLRYVERLVPHLNVGGVLVLDDIHWSSEMWSAWRIIRHRKGFSYTINAGRFGLCIWSGGTMQPKRYALYEIGGADLYAVKQLIENMKISLRNP